MSILVSFSNEDLKRGELIEPGWYTVNIEQVDEKLSAKGNSTNYVVKGKIVRHGDTGDTTFAGYPIPYWNFNSLAPGFMIGYFKALLGVDKLEADQRYDVKAGEGKQIDIFIENKEYNGAMVNGVKQNFRTPRSL